MMIADVGTILAGGGVSQPIWLGGFEEGQDLCVCIYETPGAPPEHVLGAGNPAAILRPQVQIVARGPGSRNDYDYESPRVLAQTCYDIIGNLTNQVVGAVTYMRIEAMQEPFSIGKDDNGRPLIAFNCQVWI